MAEDRLAGPEMLELLRREQAGTLSPQATKDIAELRKQSQFPPPLDQLTDRSKAILEGNEPVTGKPRSMERVIGEAALPMALSTAGALTGAAVGGPVGGVVGSVVGGAAGEYLNAPLFRAMGLEEPPSLTGNRLVDAGMVGLAGGAGELGSLAIRGAGGGLARSMSVAPAKSARRTINAMDDLGVTPKPTDVSGARLPSVLERGLAQTPAGQGVVSQTMEKQAGQVNRAADEFLDRLGRQVGPTTTGEAAKKTIGEAAKRFRDLEDKMYDQLATVANEVAVDIGPMKKLAAKMVEDESLRLPGQKNELLIKQARAIFDAPDEVPFRVLREWQKGFGRVLNQNSGLIARDIPIGEAKALWKATTEAMEQGVANSANPDAQRLFEQARKFSTKGRELFKDSSVAKIMEMDPEDAVRAVDLQGGPSAIRRAKEAILGDAALGFAENPSPRDAETWNLLRRHLFEGIFGPAAQGGSKAEVRGMMTPVLLGSKLEARLNKLGDESLTELLAPTERAALAKLVLVAKATRSSERIAAQGFTSTTPQGTAIQAALAAPGFAIGGAVAGPYGASVGGLLGYLLTAPTLARIVTSEKAARLIASPAFDAVVKSVQLTGKVSGESMQVLSRLGGILAAESGRPDTLEAAGEGVRVRP